MYKEWIKRIAIAGAMVWWVILYPELSFMTGTYQLIVRDVTDVSDIVDVSDIPDDDKLAGLLKAEDDEIIIESRLLEWLLQKQ